MSDVDRDKEHCLKIGFINLLGAKWQIGRTGVGKKVDAYYEGIKVSTRL